LTRGVLRCVEGYSVLTLDQGCPQVCGGVLRSNLPTHRESGMLWHEKAEVESYT